MEVFQVNDNQNSGTKVKDSGCAKKSDAKKLRNQLQAQEKSGVPGDAERDNQRLWRYTVGYGKDHPKHGQLTA